MSPATRACVAYAALRLISSREASAIYDCSRSVYVSIAGSVSGNALHLYDFSRNAPFGGTVDGYATSMYDHANAGYFDYIL